ncbi:AAA family ATPase [uncultured Olleya sp.]|uniref:AAA family ATPase n=1 Tax=uncultured Olleya sp. TaxID=757243 RepID=UPI00259A6B21|nr:AAA family ATPase [uncultured Olleya sp.]
MVNIREFHTEVYNYLKGLRQKESSLRYTYRKSNYGGRLDEGFWFYGNNDYLCISFWTGMDWKNRTPNIAWFFMSNGNCQLEVNVSDSNDKSHFVEKYLMTELGLVPEGRRYIKRYGYEEHAGIEYLDLFINGFNGEKSDKDKIDEIILKQGKVFFSKRDNKIDFIDQYEFRSRDLKISKYLDKLKGENIEFHKAFSKPSKVSSIKIFDYGDIKEASILNIDKSNQWIFLVGENGSGKTTVLKSLATIFGYRLLDKNELASHSNFHAEFKLIKGQNETIYNRYQNNDCNKQFPLVSSLALFGPNRLISQKDKKGSTNANSLNLALKKKGLFSPLWNLEYRMLDIEKQFDEWRREDNKHSKSYFENRLYHIRTILAKIVPGLYDIRFEYQTNKNRSRKTVYIIKKDEYSEDEIKDWRELPSGTKSVFAMVSEMLIRLYHYQKDIIDPSEFRGVVIIDEIDLHLHPKAQRDLIKDLSEIFINVQFIVSTHSPIPLLGAPKESVFVAVNRNHKEGIYLDRLIHLEKNIESLTPNILLSSEIFGDTQIYSENYNPNTEIHTEDTKSDINFNNQLKNKLSEDLNLDQINKLNKLIDPKNEA